MFEAWSVAIRIRLIDEVGSGLLGMVGRFRSANVEASALEKRIDGIRRTMLVGAGLTAAGVGILAAFKPALEQARQFQVETEKFSQTGLGDAMTAQAVKFAKSADIVGASSIQMMKYVNETMGVFKDAGLNNPLEQFLGAQIGAPLLARIHFAERTLGKPENSEAQDKSFLRVVEMLGGVKDPARFADLTDRAFKLQQSSGGTVDAELLRQVIATGGIAAKGMNNRALFGESEPLMAEMKSRFGTGIMTAFSSINGILKPPQQRIGAIREFGLWDPNKFTLNKMGGLKTMKGMPLIDQAGFADDPYRWYEKYLRPQYDKKGFTQSQRDFENTMLFGRTGGSLFSLVDRQWGTDKDPGVMQKAAIAQDKALGINQMVERGKNTLTGKEIDLHAKWNSLLVQTGEVALPIAVQALSAALPMLKMVGDFASAHPRMFAGIIQSLIDLGAALTVGGIVTSAVGAAQAFGLLGRVLGGPMIGIALRAIPLVATGVEAVTAAVAGVGALPLLGIAAGVVAIGAAIAGIAWLASQKTHPDGKPAHIGNLVLPGLSFPGDPKKPGHALGQGLAKGVKDSHPVMKSAVEQAADGVIGWTKARLGIHSPSTVFAAIGRDIVAGLVQGIDGGAHTAKAALARLLPDAAAHAPLAAVISAAVTHNVKSADHHGQRQATPYVPSRLPMSMQLRSDIHLDGHKIATVVTHHQAKEAAKPHAGTSGFDPTMALAPFGLGYQP